jgi:DNA end-binding protein Ku
MRSKAVVALGRIALVKRERVMALEPHHKGFIGTTLRYPYEVRSASLPSLRPHRSFTGLTMERLA